MVLLTNNFPVFLKYTLLIIYLLFLGYTIIRILLGTQATAKTLAYILLVAFLPIVGILIYFSFGLNYRQHRFTKAGKASLNEIAKDFKTIVPDQTDELIKSHSSRVAGYGELIKFIYKIGDENLSQNKCELLVNGEEKFPEVLRTLKTAKRFIHMEYYDWENDHRGNQIKDVLLQKAKEGVKVRIMYDAYASRKIRTNIVKELRQGGIEIYPVIKINIIFLANRINHRDHRKVIIMDGHTGFIGGINISDRYDNSIDTGLYWRDTHVKITGPAVLNMQRHFIVNWNSSQRDKLTVNKDLFPDIKNQDKLQATELTQIVAGGPIYPMSNIMLGYFKIFTLAKERLYITNPYFIPNDSILDALKQAAISGVDVRLMMPEKSDSAVVGAASKFYYMELLQAGVKIFLYKKGFVHAKTVVADTRLSVVGTANLDIRSFDLNFEIMSVNYGEELAKKLEAVFLADLLECDEVIYNDWLNQSVIKKLTYATARLISSFL